jgi:hypothetical protein
MWAVGHAKADLSGLESGWLCEWHTCCDNWRNHPLTAEWTCAVHKFGEMMTMRQLTIVLRPSGTHVDCSWQSHWWPFKPGVCMRCTSGESNPRFVFRSHRVLSKSCYPCLFPNEVPLIVFTSFPLSLNPDLKVWALGKLLDVDLPQARSSAGRLILSFKGYETSLSPISPSS